MQALACQLFDGWHGTLLSLEGRDKKLSKYDDWFHDESDYKPKKVRNKKKN
jgi:hypothetical protein